MSGRRPAISADIKRRVLMEAGYRCAVPSCGHETTELAHIVPYAQVKRHDPDNLIALCPNHHAQYDSGRIDRTAIRHYKAVLAASAPPGPKLPAPRAEGASPWLGRALREIIRLQYPWGEWSDERSAIQYEAAEREPRLIGGPKPNVARTLFALEALAGTEGPPARQAQARAMAWMRAGAREGWFREWTATRSADSETAFPHLERYADVRHTAQIASALAQFGDSRDPLVGAVRRVASAMLPEGFWPETPGDDRPKLLASVYALEALAHVSCGTFRVSLEDLVDDHDRSLIEDAFRRSMARFHREADLGGGLVGTATAGPTPYLTGIALMRLASVPRPTEDLVRLNQKLADGLATTRDPGGWMNAAVPVESRGSTRARTTLRAVAALVRASRAGVHVGTEDLASAVLLADQTLARAWKELDAADFACGAIALLSAKGRCACPRAKGAPPVERWLAVHEEHRRLLEGGLRRGVQGYRERATELDERLQMLWALGA